MNRLLVKRLLLILGLGLLFISIVLLAGIVLTVLTVHV